MSSEKRKPMDFEKEIESVDKTEGIGIESIAVGEKFRIETQNNQYILERREDGLYMSGHPKHCPTPRKVTIAGSTWGGTSLKMDFLGVGMNMEYSIVEGKGGITTSKIAGIEKIEEPEDQPEDE